MLAAYATFDEAVVASVDLLTIFTNRWYAASVKVQKSHQAAHLEEPLRTALGEAVHENYPWLPLTPDITIF